jgi:hypothetical protein
VACGMWHVACGMWHVACGTLKKVSKNSASTAFFPNGGSWAKTIDYIIKFT